MIKNYFINNLSTLSFIALMTIIVLMIAACSPHPGAGTWKAEGKNTLNAARIHVSFEGMADFYVDGKEASIRRCFWSASGERTLQMQCVHSDNTELKENYQFMVSETGQAQLSQNDRLIGLFTEQAPQEH